MDLIERLKRILKAEDIPESELISDEAMFFMRFHEGHGVYQLDLLYDEHGVLHSIDGKCSGSQISVKNVGGGCNRDEFPNSVFYERKEDGFDDYLKQQKNRRNKFFHTGAI